MRTDNSLDNLQHVFEHVFEHDLEHIFKHEFKLNREYYVPSALQPDMLMPIDLFVNSHSNIMFTA